MRRLRITAVAIVILSVLPLPAAALDMFIYCGHLPHCTTGGGFSEYITPLMNFLLGMLPTFVYFLGGLFIMIGAGLILLSAGSPERVTQGKNTIVWACVGIFIMHLTLGGVNVISAWIYPEISPRRGGVGGALPPDAISTAVGTITDLVWVGLLGVALFSGARMVLSIGKEEEFNKGKHGLIYAAIGAMILSVTDVIMTVLQSI